MVCIDASSYVRKRTIGWQKCHADQLLACSATVPAYSAIASTFALD